jgi:threonine dehydrogenase-like Zn-dependent dehydrogenase
VADRHTGDRVDPSGGSAEQVVVSNDAVFALPEPFTYAEGAAFTVAARTAYHALVERGELQTGERLLVLGATGGVGFAAVQLAKLPGRRLGRVRGFGRLRLAGWSGNVGRTDLVHEAGGSPRNKIRQTHCCGGNFTESS